MGTTRRTEYLGEELVSMDYGTQRGRLQRWLLRVLSDLRVNLEDPDFLNRLWDEIDVRFPEGYRNHGDEIFHESLPELTAESWKQLTDYFIITAILYDKSTPGEQ
jgi:hypothetical protein